MKLIKKTLKKLHVVMNTIVFLSPLSVWFTETGVGNARRGAIDQRRFFGRGSGARCGIEATRGKNGPDPTCRPDPRSTSRYPSLRRGAPDREPRRRHSHRRQSA